MSDELTPITRKETFLAKAGGQNVVTPTPITREEIFLQAIIDNGGGGGGTGGGVLVVNDNNGTLDKTWKEMSDAFDNGGLVYVYQNMSGVLVKIIVIITATNNTDMYGVSVNGHQYVTNTENGYPVLQG